MKVGNLIRTKNENSQLGSAFGIVYEVFNASTGNAPSVCKVLWCTGAINKCWTADLEVINEVH